MSVRSGPRGVGKGGSRTTYDDIVQKQATRLNEKKKYDSKRPFVKKI